MSYGLFNLARMTVSSSGTGTITLNAAVSGFLTFDLAGASTAATGQQVTYAINDTTQSEIAKGTYYSSGPSLTRGSSLDGMKSTNGNSPINMSNAAQVFITPSANDLNNTFGQCKLTYTSSNVITLAPFNGNKLTINSYTETIPSAGVTLNSTGVTMTASTDYFVYAYMSSGTMTMEVSTTGHTSASTTGVEIKSGDASRTLVGMVRQISTSWVDTDNQRFVRTWFNDSNLIGAVVGIPTFSSTSTTMTEVSTQFRFEFLQWAGAPLNGSYHVSYASSTAGSGYIGTIVDGATIRQQFARADTASIFYGAPVNIDVTQNAEGYHYVTLAAAYFAGANAFQVGVGAVNMRGNIFIGRSNGG